ncbi:MAG: glycosyltransferase [Acidimicrobiia bacterium]
MRLVLASNRLSTPGGSETYLLTLARHLQRLGHEVYVMSGPENGAADLVEHHALVRVRRAEDLPAPPDRLIVQDAIVSGEAASTWPDVPQLFVVHSGTHDLQLTSAVPGAVAGYLVLNDYTRKLAEALPGGRPVHRLTQPVDVAHFTPAAPPRPRPERLLVFGNNLARWRFEGLEATCRRRGIEVRRVGAVGGQMVLDPLEEIQAADIVVGVGRCIVEAMACGRAAFVYDRWGSDGWLTRESYAAIEAAGFAGRAGTDEPGRSQFEDVLDGYDPVHGTEGYDLAVRHHNARVHSAQVLEVLETLGPVEPVDPDLAFTLARVWREAWRWEGRALALDVQVRSQAEADAGRVQALEAELASARREVQDLEAQVAQLRDDAARLRQDLDGVHRSRSFALARRITALGRAFGRGE